MAEFRYYPEGSMQSKSKVYFTAHPKDYEIHFETILKEILDRQNNCVVFWLDGYTKPDDVEDYELKLGEMQLFVVPITTMLLTKPNRAMDYDVPFAIEHHIPILPLMQEKGLDELYARKFRDLQYLEKYENDLTTEPYDEKLTKYLESVIVGDKLAQQIRDAFDAYIFLSYRKKDRKYAQELMKIIHQKPFCRDIAIWYDEFLTPGEGFNKAIQDALDKCNLFTLTVTPNILEMPNGVPNYVMDKEYPAMRSSNKPIIPAEMIPTDKDKLNKYFDGIPVPVQANNGKELDERLLAIIQQLAIKTNDDDPQHNYLIGLAYLSGIDVEVNHEKAVELITVAADAGYIPAIKKLISMYQKGEGVAINSYASNIWREKLIDYYQNNQIDVNATELIDLVLEIANAKMHLQDLSNANKIISLAIGELDNLESQYPHNSFIDQKTMCYLLLGKISIAEGNTEDAEKWYKMGIDLLETVIGEEPDNERIHYRFASLYENLAEAIDLRGNTSAAIECLSKSIDILSSFSRSHPLNYRPIILLGCVLENQAKLGLRHKEFDLPKKLLKQILEEIDSPLNEKEVQHFNEETGETIQLFSRVYEMLGDIAEAKNNSQEAIDWYRKSWECYSTYVDKIISVETLRHSAKVLNKLAEHAQKQKDYGLAIVYYETSISHLNLANMLLDQADSE